MEAVHDRAPLAAGSGRSIAQMRAPRNRTGCIVAWRIAEMWVVLRNAAGTSSVCAIRVLPSRCAGRSAPKRALAHAAERHRVAREHDAVDLRPVRRPARRSSRPETGRPCPLCSADGRTASSRASSSLAEELRHLRLRAACRRAASRARLILLLHRLELLLRPRRRHRHARRQQVAPLHPRRVGRRRRRSPATARRCARAARRRRARCSTRRPGRRSDARTRG